MSGTVFLGFDRTRPKGNRSVSFLFNTTNFDCFELMLDAALGQYPEILSKIKFEEWYYLNNLYFAYLDKTEYDTAIQAIQSYFDKLIEPEKWQVTAQNCWHELIGSNLQNIGPFDSELDGVSAGWSASS
jgi:hypothetical protein